MTGPNRRSFRATGYPVFEAFFALLLLMGLAMAVILPIAQSLRR
jgi:hypothetical protein